MVPAEKILETARDQHVDIVGLSGLITPSLDEMVHVASEMERLHFKVPLLIGGATTSNKHTAVKIAPTYHSGTVHVTDASRAVGVASELMRPDSKGAFLGANEQQQAEIRESYQSSVGKGLISYELAREKSYSLDWSSADIAKPEFLGIAVWEDVPLSEIVPYIDWTPFFHVWELRGTYPGILEKPGVGQEAKELFANARQLLEEIVAKKLVQARGVYGFFPANAVGDDIVCFSDDQRTTELARFHTLRQQQKKPNASTYHALADFIAPRETDLRDYLGLFAVTAGHGAAELANRFEKDNDDYSAIMTKALADRLAEALAEKLHERARRDCGFGKAEKLAKEDLIRGRYRGIRPAPGYPACPDHSEKATLFRLLEAQEKAGIHLTESFAMTPPASVSGFYFNHPEAKYFALGKIGEDQVALYASRKGISKEEAERWLRPNLGYVASRERRPEAKAAQ
jgi:5-methyltetrahydrofolate--homocysteine methyltransferase